MAPDSRPDDGWEGWRISSEALLRIGLRDGAEPYLFGRVVGATRLSDGRVAVLDQMTSELRTFSADGEHEWTRGGPGDGPGEFRRPLSLHRRPGDTLEVEDRDSRIRFPPSGDLIEHRRIDWAELNRLGRFSWDCQLLPKFAGGDFLLLTPCSQPSETSDTGPWRSSSPVVRVPWDLDVADTLGLFLEEETWAFHYAGDHRRTWMPLPFRPRGHFAVGGDPSRLVFARSDSYRLEVYDLDAMGLVRVVTRVDGRRPPTDYEAANALAGWESWADRVSEMGAQMGWGGFEQRMRDLRQRLPIPDSITTLSSLTIDYDGVVWVRQAPDIGWGEEVTRELVAKGFLADRWLVDRGSSVPWDIFHEDGRYLGEIDLPMAFTPYEIGDDYVLGTLRDEFSVEFVWMYALRRGGGGEVSLRWGVDTKGAPGRRSASRSRSPLL